MKYESKVSMGTFPLQLSYFGALYIDILLHLAKKKSAYQTLATEPRGTRVRIFFLAEMASGEEVSRSNRREAAQDMPASPNRRNTTLTFPCLVGRK